jgi:ribose 5-phosphate isomerase A
MSPDEMKRAAASKAVELVEDGMRLGLGTGSTARHFVELLGQRVRAGLAIVAVPTSEATRVQAEALGIPLTTLDADPELDLVVDGADELDGRLQLIKGGGGALLREKIVANASARMVVIADYTKKVARLGHFALPVEVVSFGLGSTERAIVDAAQAAGCAGVIRLRHTPADQPFITDSGHYILDCAFGQIANARRLAAYLDAVPGVVEHGLFLDLATVAFVAGPDGVETIEADGSDAD